MTTVFGGMSLALRPRRFLLVAALYSGSLAPAHARADEPVAELSVPSPPSSELDSALADGLAKLPEQLRASFPAVVDAAESRLRGSLRAASEGSGTAIGIDDAARSALIAADFGGVSKRRAQLEAMVRLTTLQLTFDLHAAMREQLGRRLAVRAVQKCKGSNKCLDKIAPTAKMPARHVTAVRAELGNDATALAAAELATATELDVLGVMYMDGINRLTAVSTLKSNEANTDALAGANKARDLVSGQKEQK